MRRTLVFSSLLVLSLNLSAQQAPKFWGTPQRPVRPVSSVQPLDGVTMELPMNDGSGTIAHDISGNGNDSTFCTTGDAPVWSSEGLQFSEAPGTTDACLDTPLNNWQSVFVQLCPYAGAFPNSVQDPSANLTVTNAIFGSTTYTDGLSLLGSPYGNNLYGIDMTLYFTPLNENDGPTYTSQITGGCHVFAATLGTSGAGVDHLYVDGVEQPYVAQAASADLAPTVGHYQIGCASACTYSYDQFHMQGMIGYFVTSSESYTSEQVVAESNYIQGKISGRGSEVVMPGSFTGDTIIAIGDSLTAGLKEQGGVGWYQLLQTSNSYTTTSLGISGMWANDLVAMWGERETAYFSPDAATQYCHIWAGTNEINFGEPAAYAWAGLQNLAPLCIAAGGTPIIATMISRDGFDTQKNELNALIRSGWQQAGFVAIDDLAAIPEIGADGAYANPTYFADDGIHLTGPNGVCDTTTGYGIVCTAVSATINQVDANREIRKRARHDNAKRAAIYNRKVINSVASD